MSAPAEISTAHIEVSMDLTKGWKEHPSVPGGYHLLYIDEFIGEVSIVTGPRNSGLMADNNPGQEPTYEVWFPGMCEPTGSLTLSEIKGIIKYIRQRDSFSIDHQKIQASSRDRHCTISK